MRRRSRALSGEMDCKPGWRTQHGETGTTPNLADFPASAEPPGQQPSVLSSSRRSIEVRSIVEAEGIFGPQNSTPLLPVNAGCRTRWIFATPVFAIQGHHAI
ncbi:hypothetical protein OPT61_g4488 [Boeremia exigua]|uniref:Uncharacterized protein n=1 Tax=Boeremia exigua TaxID=749465 RepID=A0ACC2IDU6_9PLEO|nr:hypothetical protein OPT61_g4488 [Boeremia exigua]